MEFCGLKYLFSFFHNVPVTLNKINNSVRCGHTFWRRASCDTHALNIPWMTLNAFGPNSLKYSLKCSQEAFIICVLDVFVLYFFSFYFIKQFTLEYCVAKKKQKNCWRFVVFVFISWNAEVGVWLIVYELFFCFFGFHTTIELRWTFCFSDEKCFYSHSSLLVDNTHIHSLKHFFFFSWFPSSQKI